MNGETAMTQKLKLARQGKDQPVAMLYDCTECSDRGACARETPVTLDDMARITACLEISWSAFFRDMLGSAPGEHSGCLTLLRKKQCILMGRNGKCRVEPVRPMHCRFTSCPAKTRNRDLAGRFYLGSGTIPEQFRHHVAMEVTRAYVREAGVRYDRGRVREMLRELESRVSDDSALERFCRFISPYRYVDDTLLFCSQRQDKGVSHGRRNR